MDYKKYFVNNVLIKEISTIYFLDNIMMTNEREDKKIAQI